MRSYNTFLVLDMLTSIKILFSVIVVTEDKLQKVVFSGETLTFSSWFQSFGFEMNLKKVFPFLMNKALIGATDESSQMHMLHNSLVQAETRFL